MFFDDEDERFMNPEILHVVHRELYAITSNLEISPYYGLRNVPTHTEDGIPIRKLYVSNLPPKTTRAELFNVFAQYGFIKSCWLRMGDKGPNKTPTPTYAFVTFGNPADAHKALQAPNHEKMLRGRNLRISPADSWHQPAEDADGRVRWKPRGQRHDGEIPLPASNGIDPQVDGPSATSSSENDEVNVPEENFVKVEEGSSETEDPYNILDILNRDCMTHILSFIPIKDLIRSERVSKSWQNMIQEYLQSIRTFKTSWWVHEQSRLTTAVLRRVLQRLGSSLLRLHIDHQLSALNDRTAHTIGKFCPNLEELKVVGMYTKNWNPLLYGCKQLKNLAFVSCNKLTDSSLVHLVKNDSCIEVLTVANNTHVTGLFLTGSNTTKLHSLSFYNCYSLQGTVLCAAIDTIPNLTTLKLERTTYCVGDEGVRAVCGGCCMLQTLDLSYLGALTDAGLRAAARLPRLRRLVARGSDALSSAPLAHVLRACHQLEVPAPPLPPAAPAPARGARQRRALLRAARARAARLPPARGTGPAPPAGRACAGSWRAAATRSPPRRSRTCCAPATSSRYRAPPLPPAAPAPARGARQRRALLRAARARAARLPPARGTGRAPPAGRACAGSWRAAATRSPPRRSRTCCAPATSSRYRPRPARLPRK
ncbi:hypothetical protein evm_005435 [Chilo suppressalis]|nr:hypothetical protein evm_005435 [Chilo suppressalis]